MSSFFNLNLYYKFSNNIKYLLIIIHSSLKRKTLIRCLIFYNTFIKI